MSSSESENGNLTDLEEENQVNADSDSNESQQNGVSSESDDDSDNNKNGNADSEEKQASWEDMGLIDTLCEACRALKWKAPSKIQREAIPLALQGKDVIGLAETGSGKTGAFALPILQALLENPQRYFAVILTPTRELAYQISEQFEALGASIGIKCCVIVGGMDMVSQALHLARKPHIIIATPGRLVDHLENTKGFNLKAVKYLVMDEADRILNLDFEVELEKILKVIPRERRTFLFSATMTKKVKKLERASLKDPVKVEVSSKYQTVEKLLQYYIFIPAKYKDVYLVHILNELAGNSFMIFCSTCNNTVRTALIVNFDIPTHSKDYIHRVGRTARAGRAGKAVTFVTQYDVELYQRIEHLLGKKLPQFKCEEDEVMALQERVGEAQRTARLELKDIDDRKGSKGKKRGRRGDSDDDDTEQFNGVRKRIKKGMKGGKGKFKK
ncbi:AAEL007274-PA [Aedes aegypti]|uniref:RNA helicase n=1 Tax=Aedes aegypti TaxID=7159 RepID=Q172U1_AEDAE|nr:AAEL007274-PA [Aedes aegypti]